MRSSLADILTFFAIPVIHWHISDLQCKMYPPSAPVNLPASYSKLDLAHVRISHVPESSVEPTPVLLLTLYRPQNNNAFTEQMKESIVGFYTLVNADDRVKAVVLTGYGKMFCAGADLALGFTRRAGKSGSGETNKAERDIDHRDGYVR